MRSACHMQSSEPGDRRIEKFTLGAASPFLLSSDDVPGPTARLSQNQQGGLTQRPLCLPE